jgi:hypothetical protein
MLRLFQVFTNVFPRKLTHTRTQKRNNKRNIDFLNERETKKPILDGVKAEMSRCFEQIRNKEYRLNRVRKIGFSFQKFNDHYFLFGLKMSCEIIIISKVEAATLDRTSVVASRNRRKCAGCGKGTF